MQGNQANDWTGDAAGDRCPDDAIEWFKYIEWHELPAWEAIGWRFLGPINVYSALAKWEGAGDPAAP